MVPSDTSKGYAVLLGAAIAAGLNTGVGGSQSIVIKAERDELELVAGDDPLMADAMRKARETLADFLALSASPQRDMVGFAVKIAIRDAQKLEYFWIHPFTCKAGRFTGRLNNRPRSVRNVQMGDPIAFTEREIVDWMYMDGATMKGNYTARAMLKKAPQRQREDFKRRFGLDCEF